jgi:hypothetical protein
VSNDTVKSLTEDELSMLLFIVNSHTPKILNCDVNPHLLKSIHGWKLKEMLNKAEPNLLEEHRSTFNCLREKLGL